jgi:hypothetical protein
MFACFPVGPGGHGETEISLQGHLQIQLQPVHEAFEHEEHEKRMQGPEQDVQKGLQGLNQTAE